MASINLTVLGNLPIAIFSQAEQKQILLEIEARLSEVDQLDQTITTSLQQAEALRQAILNHADAFIEKAVERTFSAATRKTCPAPCREFALS